jgi:hypothetical protein
MALGGVKVEGGDSVAVVMFPDNKPVNSQKPGETYSSPDSVSVSGSESVSGAGST